MRRGRLPSGQLRAVVRMNARTYTIYSEESSSDGWDSPSATLSDTGNSAKLHLFGGDRSFASYPTGETVESAMNGIAVPEDATNLDDGHLVTHGGEVFEVTTNPWPDSDDPDVLKLSLTERTDVSTP